jgi:hypothetical protein
MRLAGITADGVNTVTVDNVPAIPIGEFNIDIATLTGTVLASNRQVTSLTSAGVLTYSGADVTAVPGTHFIYPTGAFAGVSRSNLNGGYSDRGGFQLDTLDNVDQMIARLQAANASYWTAARIATHTINDLAYAIRLLDAPGSIR